MRFFAKLVDLIQAAITGVVVEDMPEPVCDPSALGLMGPEHNEEPVETKVERIDVLPVGTKVRTWFGQPLTITDFRIESDGLVRYDTRDAHGKRGGSLPSNIETIVSRPAKRITLVIETPKP